MIVFPEMLRAAAQKAGISVPKNADAFSEFKEEYPHFFVFCMAQLGREMIYPGEQFDNAQVIAAISLDRIKTITFEELLKLGFSFPNHSSVESETIDG